MAGTWEKGSLCPGGRRPSSLTPGGRNVSVCLSAPPAPFPLELPAQKSSRGSRRPPLGAERMEEAWGDGKRAPLAWRAAFSPPPFPSVKRASSLLCLTTTPLSMSSGPHCLARHQPPDPGDPFGEGAEAGAGVDRIGEPVGPLPSAVRQGW